jgi:hypothetical protein
VWIVRYFVEEDGEVPGDVFEATLEPKLRGKLLSFVEEVARAEGAIGGGIFKKCHGGYSGLYEVRAKLGKALARSLCSIDRSSLIMYGGVKKSLDEETPTSILDAAAAQMRRYRETGRVDPPF